MTKPKPKTGGGGGGGGLFDGDDEDDLFSGITSKPSTAPVEQGLFGLGILSTDFLKSPLVKVGRIWFLMLEVGLRVAVQALVVDN